MRRSARVIPAAMLVAVCANAQQASVTLTASGNSVRYGQVVVLTASVSPAAATGQVTYYDGTTILGTGSLSGGVTNLSTGLLSCGAHSLRARYTGNAAFSPINSSPISMTVSAVPLRSFTPGIPYFPDQAQPFSAGVVADFNGDGKPDVAMVNAQQGMVFLSNRDGTFQAPLSFPGGGPIASGDFNGDGKTDLITGGHVLLGNGDGTFQVGSVLPAGRSIAVGDFNGDGKSDVAIVTQNPDLAVDVSLGNGDGTFRTGAHLRVPPFPFGSVVAIGDFDGDGNADVIAATQLDYSLVFFGKGNGTFSAGTSYSAGGTGMAIGDINHDGIDDAVMNSGVVLLGSRDGMLTVKYAPRLQLPFRNFSNGATLADFDGDGNLDAAFQFGGATALLLGNGDGTFHSPQVFNLVPAGAGGSMPATFLGSADFNGDGRVDLASGFGFLLGSEGLTSSVMLASSPNPSAYGQGVTFFDGTTDWGTVALAGGMAQLTVNLLPAGSNPMTAVYTGDLRYGASTSPVVTQTVGAADA